MLALAFLLALTSCFLAFSYPPLIPAMISDIRMTHAQAGLVFSVLVLAVMASRIPWGLACDRVGLKTTLGFAAVLMALFGLLRGSATDYGMVLACQLLFGVGYAGVMPCLPRLVAEWFPGRETGFATGLYMAGFSLGIIVGLGFTHHLLALLGGWRGVFYTYGALGMISAIVWWALSRRSEAEAPSAGREALTGAGVVEAVKMREVWALVGIFLCAVACHDTLLVWLPYMLVARGFSPATTGLTSSAIPLGMMTSPATGALSDRIGSRRLVILTLGLIAGATVLAIGVVASPPLLGALAFTLGLCTFGVSTLVLAVPAERMKMARLTASIVGLITSIGNVGSLIMPTLVGYIKDVTGTFLLSMALLAALVEGTAILSLWLKK